MYALLLASLTSVAWGIYLAQGRPELERPLFESADRFRDMLNYTNKIDHLGDGAAALGRGFPVYNYLAPAAYLYAFFLRGFRGDPICAFLVTLGLGLLGGSAVLWWAGSDDSKTNWGLAAAILSTAILGSPMMFAADRGNLEGVVQLILGAGLILFAKQRYYGSAVFIGLAASLKPFPAIFLLLLLTNRRYREFATGIAVAVASVLLALTALGPTPIAAYRGLRPGMETYYYVYVANILPPEQTRFGHSITDALKSVANNWAAASTHNMHLLLTLATLLDALVFAFVLLRIFKMPALNRMIMLGVAVTLFPPVAAEYTLLALYVPFGVFVIFLVKDVATGRVYFERRHILILLILFALLFSPMTFLGRDAGVAKTLMLLCLLVCAGSLPMPSLLVAEGNMTTDYQLNS
jgi:hypothetical protein